MYKLLMFRSTCLLSAILFLPAIVMAGEGDERFREGYQHYNRSRWKEAADSFATFTTSFPDHSNAAVASFFRAESLLQLKDHQAAGQQYEQFLVQHPGHQYQRHAEFRVAETAFLSARFTKAELELRQFQRRYPDTELINYVMVYLGETQLALGKTEPAEGTFQRALEQFSDNDLGPRYQLGLARALLAQDKEEGEQLIAKIFTTLSTDLVDDAMFARASYKYRHESYVECEQICLQIIQDFPKSDLRPQVDHRLGTAIAEQGRYEESARLLVAAAREFPAHKLTPAIWYRAGVTLKQGGHLEAAERVFARTTELHPASSWSNLALIDRLNVLRQFDPSQAETVLLENVRQLRESAEPELRLELGRALLRMKKREEGNSVLKVLSKDPQATNDIVGQALLLQAETQLAQQNYSSTIQLLNEIDIAEAPSISQATVTAMLAQAHYGMENWEMFASTTQQYLTNNPDGAESANFLAKLVVAEVQQGQLDDGLQSYAKYIQHAPKHEGRHEVERVLADTALAQNKYDLAKEFYTKLARDGNPSAYVQRGLLGLGWVEAKLKNMDASVKSFELAAERSRTNADREKATLGRAQALELAGNFDGALAIYLEISEHDEDRSRRATAIFRGALIHKHLKQWDEAVARFEKFTVEFPDRAETPAALYHLAWTLTDRGDRELAELMFHRLSTEFAESQYGQRARYRLAQQALISKDYSTVEKLSRAILATRDGDAELRDHAQYMLGKVSVAQQEWTEVISRLTPLQESSHGIGGHARYLVADATFRLGRSSEAAELLNDLAEWPGLQQKHNRALIPLVTLRRAQVFGHLKQWQLAKELSNTLRDDHQDFAMLYEADYVLGRVHFTRGEFTKARDAFERVVRSPQGGQTETAAMAQWMIGESLLHQNRTELALQAYNRVKNLFPAWKSAALLQAAKCHELNGQWQEAVKKYAEILQDYPTTEYAPQASDRLKLARNRASLSR